jgi:cytochrome c biogenesis protein CcdA
MVLFGSPDCEECAEIRKDWRKRKADDASPVLFYVNIDDEENFMLFKQVEKALPDQKRSSSFPVVLAGKTLSAGYDGYAALIDALPACLDGAPADGVFAPFAQAAAEDTRGGLVKWDKPAVTKAQIVTSVDERSYYLLYLYKVGCQKCARQERELESLRAKLPKLVVERYDIGTPEGQVMRQRVLRHFNLPSEETRSFAPAVIWQTGYIEGAPAPEEELLTALSKDNASSAKQFWQEADASEDARSWSKVLEHATWLTITLAGLADGINPCAFATVIFLISYLLYLKRGRRYVLGVGLSFCFGVFLTYLLFGFGLSYFVNYLNHYPTIKTVLYGAFALLGIIFAILHLRDAIRYRCTGKASDMDMGLNAGAHRKIHERIKRWTNHTGWLAFPMAVILGAVVSSLELVCTGQIYLPVLMAVNSAGFNLKACAWLLLYNLAFIIPLVAVTLCVFWGAGAQGVAKWARDHVFATKLTMAVVFLLLAALMIAMAA